ncbi:hypothetical protein [Microbacterium sp.]|uniref:hypothetical protein n=1 Tax=Microbacterium sp. TaxID=51671 RepID=UPI00263261EF|nr:hypothetical protein [Microbacterium sp.]
MPTWVSVVIVAVLILAVGGLSWLAITRTQTPPPTEAPRVTPTMGVETPTATPTPTPTVTVAAATGPGQRFLATSEGVWWRATAGQCGSIEPLLERSTDAGQTWSDVTPRYLGIGQILSLSPYAADQAQMVALMGADCTLQGMRTFTDGQFWEPNGEILASSTYIDPANPVAVVTPAGTLDAPCGVPTGVRAGAGTTAVICGSDASQSTDAATWSPLEQPGVLALTVAGDGQVTTARADAASCDGMLVAQPGAATCIPSVPTDAPVAVTLDGDGTPWVWAGNTFVSTR